MEGNSATGVILLSFTIGCLKKRMRKPMRNRVVIFLADFHVAEICMTVNYSLVLTCVWLRSGHHINMQSMSRKMKKCVAGISMHQMDETADKVRTYE